MPKIVKPRQPFSFELPFSGAFSRAYAIGKPDIAFPAFFDSGRTEQ
jgi:hypothetical protein